MEKYETIHRLGHGGCASVYLVRNSESKKLFALKKIELDERKKTRTKEAVQKEASILSRLKHPHIVAFHESFCDQSIEYLYIIQDYCDGGCLDDRIKDAAAKSSYFSENTIMNWFVQMVMAVQYIHSNKILHRDLKTENVFLTKKDMIKIGDFGISKVLENTIDLAKTVVGTPTYLSPELCQDIPYSSKSDVWALGCILYEVSALKPPFDAQSLISLFFKIIKAEFEAIPTQYSSSLHDLVSSLLTKSPDDRPSTSAILHMPYVKQYISSYIEETKQSLQQAKGNNSSSSKSSLSVPDISTHSPLHKDLLKRESLSPAIRRRRDRSSGRQDNSKRESVSPAIRRKRDRSSGRVEATDQKQEDGASSKCKPVLLTVDAVQTDSPGSNREAVSDYSDDFDSSDEEIEEDIEMSKEGEVGSDNDSDVDYADDFEEYDPSEDLDQIVNQVEKIQQVSPDEDFFSDDRIQDLHRTHTNFFKRQCIDALGDRKVKDVGKLIMNGTLTENDFKKQLRHTVGDSTEICHLDLDELPNG